MSIISIMSGKRNYNKLLIVFITLLFFGFILRLYLSQFLTFYPDLIIFKKWGEGALEVGFSNFYSEYFCDYMPGYIFILALIAKINLYLKDVPYEILYKLPANISDLLIAVLIYITASNFVKKEYAIFAAILFFLNPAVLSNSTHWGQVDTLNALPLAAGILFLINKRIFLAGVFCTISFLIKPQAIVFSPLILMIVYVFSCNLNNPVLKKQFGIGIAKLGSAFVLTCFIIALPFVYQNIDIITDVFTKPAVFIYERFIGSYGRHQFASMHAVNFWGMFAMWKSDQTLFLNLTYQAWGTVLFLIFFISILIGCFNNLRKTALTDRNNLFVIVFETVFLISFATYLFVTRAHERHMLMPIVLLSFLIIRYKEYIIYLTVLSGVYVFQMFWAYKRLITDYTTFTHNFFTPLIYFLGCILILVFVFMIIDYLNKSGAVSDLVKFVKHICVKYKNNLISRNIKTVILVSAVIVGFLVRINDVGYPDKFMFDEVYYAFTAQEITKGNLYAWGKDYSYPGINEFEWTHPPLGKEIISLGILVFGDSPFAWRIFQVLFGAAAAMLIFLLARNIFNSVNIGMFSAILYLLDPFPFVLSRIAMVDIFLFVFLISACLFTVKYLRKENNKFLYLSGIFLGLAVSVKWTALSFNLFILICLFISYLYKNKDKKIEIKPASQKLLLLTLSLVFIPIVIYILSYIPFFIYKQSFSEFIALHKSMLRYHESVKNPHNYQSAWWSWILVYKPLLLYFEKVGRLREYIYTIGNPVIWWTGIAAIIAAIIQIIRTRSYPLIFVISGMFISWLPWILSPKKVIFIYHFLPTLMFLYILVAYFIDKIWSISTKGKMIVLLYFFLSLSAFVYLFPILTAETISVKEFNNLLWFKVWK